MPIWRCCWWRCANCARWPDRGVRRGHAQSRRSHRLNGSLRLQPTFGDRLVPAAVGVVSRAWVIALVLRVPALSDAERRQLVDQLCDYQPPRRHALRNQFIAWAALLGSAMVFTAVGLPGWLGFLVALAILIAAARWLAVQALRWRLEQLLAQSGRSSASNERAP